MNASNIPGFTAENAIFKSPARYSGAGGFDSQSDQACVQPAVEDICDILYDMLLPLPSGGAAERFIIGAMFGAGCFQ